MLTEETEVLYGGAASGGKSWALLAAAAQFVHVPGYSALLLRRSFSDLMQADALIPRSKEWWSGKAEYSSQNKRWTFPSGATITFGYLERDAHVYQYQGAAFQFIGIDELTQHTEFRYRYLFSRLRRLTSGPLADVPIRMRAGTNPGGIGADWVRRRFIPDEYLRMKGREKFSRIWRKNGTCYVPSQRHDNPHLDQAQYAESLAKLDPITRAQLEEGDWTASADGHFKAHWFRRYRHMGDALHLPEAGEVARLADCSIFLAIDPAGGISEAADYTAITALARTPRGNLCVLEVVRDRFPVEAVVAKVLETSKRHQAQWMVWESSFLQSAYIRQARATPGMPAIHAIDPGGKSKLVRATPAILRAEAGQIWIPDWEPDWLAGWLAELTAFTGDDRLDAHDDQVDSLAYGVLALDRFGLGFHDDSPASWGERSVYRD